MRSIDAAPPEAVKDWLGPKEKNKGTYPIDLDAACRDLFATELVLGADVTPSPNIDRVERDVAKLLRPVFTEMFYERSDSPGEPQLRMRDAGTANLEFGWGEGISAYRELLDRSIPLSAFVATELTSDTRIYAIAEEVDVATSRLLERAKVLAPRIACGHASPGTGYYMPVSSTAKAAPDDAHGYKIIEASMKMFISDYDASQSFLVGARRSKKHDATIVVTRRLMVDLRPDAADMIFEDRVMNAIEPIFSTQK